MTKLISASFLLFVLASCEQRKKANNSEDNQQDSIVYLNKSIDFIKKIMSEELKDSTFVLADRPFTFDYFNCLDEILADTVTFSKEEIQSIIAKGPYKINHWKKQNFPYIRLVNADTVKSIFEDKAKGWGYFYKNIGREFHEFSYPIFIRDFIYCLFYSDNSCGWTCGTGRLTLYKFQKGKWTEIKSYCNWIS